MPDWILLLPICLPLIGTLIFSTLAPRISPRLRAALWIIFLLLEIAAILVNIAPGTHRLVISQWQLASFAIVLQMDGVTQLLLLTMFIPLLALQWIAPRRAPFDFFAVGILTGAILLTSAENLATAYIAWAILDLALFLWRLARNIERETALRAIVIGQFTGLILIAGALLPAAGRPLEGAWIIAIAYWARLGLFPFHYLLPTRGGDAHDLWFARGIPLIAAASLWLRWSALQLTLPIPLIGGLAACSLIAALVWIWREELPERAVVVGASSAIVLIPLTIALSGGAAIALALWLTLSIALALALFEIALRWRADPASRLPRLIWFAALFSLAGLPLTPAFLGRVGLVVALWESGNGLLMFIVGVATLAVLTPLWNFGFALKGIEARRPTRTEFAGIVVVAMAFAALALLPTLIASALAPGIGDSAERAIDLVIRTNDVLGVVLGFVVLLIPVIGSFFLQLLIHDWNPQPGSIPVRLARLIDLEWVERIVVIIGLQMGRLARNAVTITEENPTVWILFVALWIAIFVMFAR